VTRDLELLQGETVTLPPEAFIVETLPTELEPVVVEADAPRTRRSLADFWERRERGSGKFITREEFEEMGNPQKATDVLRRMGGFHIQRNPYYMREKNPGDLASVDLVKTWVLLTRTLAPRSFTRATEPCFPLYFIDRLYIGNAGAIEIDDILPLLDMEAVEAYSSLVVPREFARQGFECGVVVFWTR
jgi:hypothetical protein